MYFSFPVFEPQVFLLYVSPVGTVNSLYGVGGPQLWNPGHKRIAPCPASTVSRDSLTPL